MTFDENGFTTEAGYIEQYFYNVETGEYSRHTNGYLPQGVSLPPNATTLKPDATLIGYVSVWDGEKWVSIEDHRGQTVYRISDKVLGEWLILGPVDDGIWTLLKPNANTDKWDGEKWVNDPEAVDKLIEEKNSQLKIKLTTEANHQISVLTDATDPDIMGDDINPEDVTNLKLWKAYRVQLSRVTDMLNPVWPKQPNA